MILSCSNQVFLLIIIVLHDMDLRNQSYLHKVQKLDTAVNRFLR